MVFRNRSIQISGDALPVSDYGTAFMQFKSATGREYINDLFEYDVFLRARDEYGGGVVDNPISKDTALAGGPPGSNFPLQSIIGTLVNISIEEDGKIDASNSAYGEDVQREGGGTLPAAQGKGIRHINGLVTQAKYQGVEGRHAIYKITLRPWLWLLTQSSDYKVWQNKSIPEIINDVLLTLPYPVESRLKSSYPQLDYQIQYGETHYHFIKRLMEEVGISYHFEHSDGTHKLILTDNLSGFKEMSSAAYKELYVYPPNLKILEEYIFRFEPTQTHTTGNIRLNDFQFKTPTADLTTTATQPWDTAFNRLEKYEWHQGDYLNPDVGQGKAGLRAQEMRQHGHRAIGEANVRGLQVAHYFNLRNHPSDDANINWLVLGTEYELAEVSEESGPHQSFSVCVRFLVQPGNELLRPDRLLTKPHAPTQTATVVGPEGKEVWVDQYGRIRIQFHWDRYGAKDENSSCWVRVSNPWQGPNFGGVHHPRIGQEVVIDFFHHDPDLPYVSGRMANPNHMPLWELPSQYVLSGFKSKEIDGSQNNHLIMDDSPKEVQIQLTSDHGLSQLNLGYITRIPDVKGRKDYRGQGFELRTDHWGAIRASQGMLITTEGRSKGAKYQRDMPETIKRLTEAQEIHLNMGEVAAQHQAMDDGADQTHVSDALKAQNQAIKGGDDASQLPELTAPHLVIASPAGIETTTPESMHMHTGQHLAMTSSENTSIVSQKSFLVSVVENVRMFAYKTGMKLIAASADIDIKALKNNINLFAKLNITQNANKIIITAKEEIIINGGGSYTKWNGGGIESGTAGMWVVHAAQHLEPGPKSMAAGLKGLKPGKGNLELNKVYKDEDDKTVEKFAGAAYQVIDAIGVVKKGQLDKQGHAMVAGLATGPAKVILDKDPREPWKKPQNFGKYQWPKSESASDAATAQGGAASFIDSMSGMAGKASQLLGAAAQLTGSRALGNIAQGLGQATSLAGAMGSGSMMGIANQALGVASSYVPGLAPVAQGLGALQGIAGGSGVMPEPSGSGRIDMANNPFVVGGGFSGSLRG